MVFLWSDGLFIFTLFSLVGILAYAYHNRILRDQITELLSKPLAASSLVILMFFIITATLDSLHFEIDKQESTHLYSLLDKLLSPLDKNLEKTYSKPMALTSYTAEIDLQGAEITQYYPVLNYPPQGIDRREQLKHAWLVATGYSLAVTVLIYELISFFYAMIYQKKMAINTGALGGIATLFLCLLITIASYKLSRSLHILGTGIIGQDIFYQTVKSIRTGILIGTLTSLFMVPLAIITGVSAGYFGGLVDDVIQYIYITLSSVPSVLLITASVLSLQTYITNHPLQFPTLDSNADARLLALCFILGITSWTSLCRLLRAETLKLRAMDFVQAAKCLGSSSIQILFKHLIPNVLPIIIMTVVLDFSFLVLAEAVLSYVGVGVSPLTISWGNMINSARLELAREPIVWWPMLAAFIGMFILVLAVNLFADAIRDVLDPKHEQ